MLSVSAMIPTTRLMEEYVEVTYQDRTLQLRPSQLTVSSLARTFRLVGNTIFLISTSGTVAIPDDDGSFPDLDTLLSWTVEGDQATTTLRSTSLDHGSAWAPVGSVKSSGKDRWRPQAGYSVSKCNSRGLGAQGDSAGPSTPVNKQSSVEDMA